MSRGPDAATLLERALALSAAEARCTVRLVRADWTRWSSVTFTGARHMLELEASAGAALDQWLAALPDAELPVRNHLVADLNVMEVRREGDRVHAVLEVLTVEDRPD